MSEGGGGGADVSSMTTPSTIVIEETDGRLRAGGDDIANLAVLALWLNCLVGHEPARSVDIRVLLYSHQLCTEAPDVRIASS